MSTNEMSMDSGESVEATVKPVDDASRVVDARRGRLYATISLVLIAGIFVLGVMSWVRFYQSQGGPTGLFTNTDYPAITIASRIVSSGRGSELYNLNLQLEGQRSLIAEGYVRLDPTDELKYPYPYSPVIAVLWSPLSGLSPLTAMAIWDLLNIAAMAFGLWYLLTSLPLPTVTRLLVLLAGLTCFPFIVNLEQGQSSGLVMLAFGVGLGLLRRERDLYGGLALGLLAVKVQWLPVMVVVLLLKWRWRALLGVGITTLALLSVVTLTIGTRWIGDYANVVVRAQSGAREFLLDPWYSHSLTGGLTALMGRGAEDAIRLITLLASALLLVVLLERWKAGSQKWDGLMALTLLVALLTNLHLNTHDLCLLVLPAALGLSYTYQSSQSGGARILWYALLWTAYLVTALPPGVVFAMPVRPTTLVMTLMLGFMAVMLVQRPTAPLLTSNAKRTSPSEQLS